MSDAEGPSTRHTHTIRHTAVTYGRRLARVPEQDTPLPSLSGDYRPPPVVTTATLEKSPNAYEAEEVTRRLKSASLSPVPGREDSGDDSDAVSESKFEWSWKQKLQDIDEEFNKPARQATNCRSQPTSASQRSSTRRDSATPEASDDIPDGSLSELTESSQHTDTDESRHVSRSNSPLPRKRVVRRAMLALPDDAESEGVDHQASSHVSSPPPFRITTPPPRSPSTPPTSLGTSAIKVKEKGKERAIDASSSESELEYDSSTALVDGHKRNRSKVREETQGQKRTKRPTKKEKEKARKTTARLIAEQSVSLPHGQTREYPLTNFLQKLDVKLKVKPPAATTTKHKPSIPESDPIQPFSSSPTKPATTLNRPPSSVAQASPVQPLSTISTKKNFSYRGLLGPLEDPAQAQVADECGSDDELPDLQTVLRDDERKRAAERLRRDKIRILQQQTVQQQPEECDSDLEIVQDDAKTAIKEEAKERRVSASHKPSAGRQRQLAFARPALVPRIAPSTKAGAGLAKDGDALLAAGISLFATSAVEKKDRSAVQLSQGDLNHILLLGSREQSAKITQQKEEEWKRRGGKLKDPLDTKEAYPDVKTRMGELLAKASSSAQGVADIVDADDDEGSDGEYQPDEELSGVDEKSDNDVTYDSDENVTINVEGTTEVSERETPERPSRPHPHRRRPLTVVESDDEDAENRLQRPGMPVATDLLTERTPSRESVSSLDERTEDETDKENDENMKFDRGEDKENTSIILQPLSASRPLLARSFGSLHELESELVRSPLKELPSADEEDDPFLLTPSRGGPRKLVFAVDQPSSPFGSPSETKPNDLFEADTLRPAKGPAPVIKSGGLSQFFSPSGKPGMDRLRGAAPTQDLSLTLDVGLQPALEVNETLRRKADDIFEKEQVYCGDDTHKADGSAKFYINDHGFLTQTRPDGSSPEAYRPKSPSQHASMSSSRPVLTDKLVATQPTSPSSDEFDILEEHPRRRLVKRGETSPSTSRLVSHSPSPPKRSTKNAFGLLRWSEDSRTPKMKTKAKLGTSDFIEGEAEESDDDVAIGFGARKEVDDGEDSDGEDQDQTLAELVDDDHMDVETLAEDAVREKAREHLEEDDKVIEKVHWDAVHGKFRTKRRRAGLDFEDSDSDDEDEHAKNLRQTAVKKRKIEGDTLDSLAKNDDTLAFVQAYNHDEDDTEDFAHMQQEDTTLVEEADRSEEQEVVSMEQIIREGREKGWDNVKTFDTHDVGWFDLDSDQEDTIAVKEVVPESRTKQDSSHLPWNATQRINEPSTSAERAQDGERARLEQWAKTERATSRFGGYGRSSGGSAVTGHGKAKSASMSQSSKAGTSGAKQLLKTVRPSSVLSAVSSRRGKFNGP